MRTSRTSHLLLWVTAGLLAGGPLAAQMAPAAAVWNEGADETRMSIQEYSERWFPYPYPQVSTVEGPEGGMEYPMLAMTSGDYGTLTHEVGHNWFPMIVGSNERMHAWMDEGFNTFHQHLQ